MLLTARDGRGNCPRPNDMDREFFTLSKPEWGIKRVCQSCGTRFYDLQRDPIICPNCGATFDPDLANRARRRTTRAVAASPKPDTDEDEGLTEDVDAEEEEEEAEASTDEDEEEDVDGGVEDTAELSEDDDLPDAGDGNDDDRS